jgi:hypothetical protein
VVTSDPFVAWKQQGCFPKNTALGTMEMGLSLFERGEGNREMPARLSLMPSASSYSFDN